MVLTSPRFRRNIRLQQAERNSPPIRYPERDYAVRIIQQAMIDLKIHPLSNSVKKYGSPDGIFGRETKEAVKKYQTSRKITFDGVVGKNTMRALDTDLPNPVPELPPLPHQIRYTVPNMKLIPQDKTMSCWYASGMMLIKWRRRSRQMTEQAHPDPSQVAKWQSLYKDNTGITNAKIMNFARDLGLKAVPPMSPTVDTILNWLRTYGPLWVNGKYHITVIAGIRDTGTDTEVLVFDPAKPAKLKGEWRSLIKWYISNPHSGRDTASAVKTVFLYMPIQ